MDKCEEKQGLKVETGAATADSVTKGNIAQTKPRQIGNPNWTKGVSGNPNGRPKDELKIRQLAREYGPEAIQRLVEWMRSDNPKASVPAAQTLLDRGYGKPIQQLDVRRSPLDDLDPDQLIALRAALVIREHQVIEHDPAPALPEPEPEPDPALDQPDQS